MSDINTGSLKDQKILLKRILYGEKASLYENLFKSALRTILLHWVITAELLHHLILLPPVNILVLNIHRQTLGTLPQSAPVPVGLRVEFLEKTIDCVLRVSWSGHLPPTPRGPLWTLTEVLGTPDTPTTSRLPGVEHCGVRAPAADDLVCSECSRLVGEHSLDTPRLLRPPRWPGALQVSPGVEVLEGVSPAVLASVLLQIFRQSSQTVVLVAETVQ